MEMIKKKLTQEDIKSGLISADQEIRLKFAQDLSFTPTPDQIERGLTDEDYWVRTAWGWRLDFTPTPEQIERGLLDSAWDVRFPWFKRMDFTPTPEQIERGLTDAQPYLVWVFIRRGDYRLKDYLEYISVSNRENYKDGIEAILYREQAEEISAKRLDSTLIKSDNKKKNRPEII